jgi:hypothetical protein
MTRLIFLFTLSILLFSNLNAQNLNEISESFVNFAKVEKFKQMDSIKENCFDKMTLSLVKNQLNSDNKKIAFWLNLYNGFALFELKKNSKTSTNVKTVKLFKLDGYAVTLNFIKNSILRKSKTNRSFLFYHKLFPNKIEKELRVDSLNPRIHFALNWGARSCPPIAIYQPDRLIDQLKLAERVFLRPETHLDIKKRLISTTPLLKWYSKDFGGKKGIRRILKKNGLLIYDEYSIKYNKFNNDLNLSNFDNY